MPETPPWATLIDALRDLTAWIRSEAVPGMLIGGVAASLLGRPRVTRDVDAVILIDESRWESFLTAGTRFGFAPRRADALAFARKSRVLLVRHAPSSIDADIVFGELPFERKAIGRARWVDAAGLRLPLPASEDLIVMKALAHRPRDMADIEGILDAQPRLDLRAIRRHVRELAAALDMPEIESDLLKLLERRRK